MSGRIYDINEEKNAQALIDKQNAIFKQEESSNTTLNYKILQYSILGVSAIIILGVLKYFVSRKNK
jgi:hypothetical protein